MSTRERKGGLIWAENKGGAFAGSAEDSSGPERKPLGRLSLMEMHLLLQEPGTLVRVLEFILLLRLLTWGHLAAPT